MSFSRFILILRKNTFLGGKLWTQSYFAEMIGNSNKETIRKYVKNQLTELDQRERYSDQLDLF
ncbi:MAG: transposase [Colwellia sp.]